MDAPLSGDADQRPEADVQPQPFFGATFHITRIQVGSQPAPAQPAAGAWEPPIVASRQFPVEPKETRIVGSADARPESDAPEPTPVSKVLAFVRYADFPHVARGAIGMNAALIELYRLATEQLVKNRVVFASLRLDRPSAFNPRRPYHLVGCVPDARAEGAWRAVSLDQAGTIYDAWLRMRAAMPQPARFEGKLHFELRESGGDQRPIITTDNRILSYDEMVARLKAHLAKTFPAPSPNEEPPSV